MRKVADSHGKPLPHLKQWKKCEPFEKTMSNMTVGLMVFESKDIFTLTDLLSLLPKKIKIDSPNADGSFDTEDCYLCMQWCTDSDCADNYHRLKLNAGRCISCKAMRLGKDLPMSHY